jgi:hypothetical protein
MLALLVSSHASTRDNHLYVYISSLKVCLDCGQACGLVVTPKGGSLSAGNSNLRVALTSNEGRIMRRLSKKRCVWIEVSV